jgi:sister-chromatid-cohesion protein PDS5
LKPLIHAVLSCGLLHHEDKDVKLTLAVWITELFRVKAPEPPFQDNHLRVTLIQTQVCDCQGFFF